MAQEVTPPSARPREQAEDEQSSFHPHTEDTGRLIFAQGERGDNRWRKKKKQRFGFPHNKRVSQLMERKGDKTLNLHDSVP